MPRSFSVTSTLQQHVAAGSSGSSVGDGMLGCLSRLVTACACHHHRQRNLYLLQICLWWMHQDRGPSDKAGLE
jgi:hypothetical protein